MDEELERLKRRRLLELQRRMLARQEEAKKAEKPDEPTDRELLGRHFVGRAWEVYNAALSQFPSVMPQVEAVLAEAMRSGRLTTKIDGEGLFQFLRQIGLPVRLQTTIRYSEHGELKTLEQKMKEKS